LTRRLTFPVLLAVVYTALNAVKPLHIDDAAYECYARQMGAKPLDPYGFAVFWWEWPQPANEVLAPPVFCYSWAVAHRFSDKPVVWKVCLLPWSLLLVFGLRGLLLRFARKLERPLLVLLVLSPALLPSMNLMLDVPALALSVAALNLYFGATDRDSLGQAALAGLVAGLAMQTKYTALLVPGVMLLSSATTGRWRLWPAAVVVAAQLFVAWEFLIALQYGRSHFLLNLSAGGGSLLKVTALPFLSSYLGGLCPVGIALGLAALGVARRLVWCAMTVMLAGFVVIALFDVRFVTERGLFGQRLDPPVELQLAELIFNCYAVAGAVVVALIVRRLLQSEQARARAWSGDHAPARCGDRSTLFLVLWLGLEVLGYVALTPFPAARRVLGVSLVLALLVGRLAARRARLLWRRGLVQRLTACGVMLGLVYWALDWYGAWVQQHAAETAAQYAADHGGGRVWYVGHWGFQFYAERAGMRPVVPRYPDWFATDGPIPLPASTVFAPGDWLVLPETRLEQQWVKWPLRELELQQELRVEGWVPLRTVSCFYAGRTPLEHQEGACLAVRIFRVQSVFAAEPGERPHTQFGR
jgi:hypothetical protein